MRARLGLVVLGIALTATFAAAYQATPPGAAQTAAPPPASISGSVVDGVTGAPVTGADVIFNQHVQRGTAIHFDGPKASGPTDAAGRFTITGAPIGRLRMHVTKEGYLEGLPDQLGPSDMYASGSFFLDVAAGEQVKDITVKLWRASTISGVVEDEARDPLVGESVVLLQRRHEPGGVTIGLGSITVRTDDRGRFQLTGVRPGEYYLMVSPSQPPVGREAIATPPHLTAYYPGAQRLDDASVLRVGSGDMLDGINVTVGIGGARRGRIVAGRLIGPDDRIGSVEMRLVEADAPRGLAAYAGGRARTGGDGTFSFPPVMPGRYRILVTAVPRGAARFLLPTMMGQAPISDEPILWADESVVVDANDVEDLVVPLKTGGRIRGRLVFDGGKSAPTPDELLATRIMILPRDRSSSTWTSYMQVAPGGLFMSVAVPPGVYSLLWSRPEIDGWYPSTIRVDGRDAFGAGVEVGADNVNVEFHMLARSTTLAGSVSDAQGRPVTQARVLMFPRDSARWSGGQAQFLVRQIILNSKGRFSEQAYPGDYLVAAISSVPANWGAPEFLETLVPRATRATPAAGETIELSLRALAVP